MEELRVMQRISIENRSNRLLAISLFTNISNLQQTQSTRARMTDSYRE